ncbi:MAG: TonB-dependent receptor [Gammaproteobacteria bacterium]|nr:TonB-dependent receptor [Gammaproteobacteria bacterium]
MKSTTETLGKYAYPALAALVLSLGASGTSADEAEVLTLDIKPQQAGSALMELAGSSGVQILVSDEAGADVEVEGLTGEYKFDDALAALLTDTSLAYEYTSDNVVLVQQAQAQPQESGQLEEVEAPDETASVEEREDPLELSQQTVTGSRLLGGDPSARVFSFTAEDIARRGVSNLEDFFRRMAWHQASLNSQTSNANSIHTNDARYSRDSVLPGNGLGVSALNLRGLGWENTLVLMNGRRLAGTGGIEDDFVNLLDVPLAAIERVDVQLDGSSAVYGSDALGGVVNFITKKDYQGLSATYRRSYSSTDADSDNANITAGYGWGSGNITAIATHSTSEPINNAKTGWTTLDFRPLFGPEFDFRDFLSGQPGVVCVLGPPRQWNPAYPPSYRCPGSYDPAQRAFLTTYHQLPASHSGAGATADDFVTWRGNYATPSPVPLDELPPQNGQERENMGLVLSMEQYLTDDLRLFADVKWNTSENYQEFSRRMSGNALLVPASNAYNPFGAPVQVRYAPVHEFETGLLPVQYDWSESENRTIAVGGFWNIADSHVLEVEANRTKSWRNTRGYRATGARGALDPTAEAFYAALSSPDPARALNPFGNGTAQGSAFAEFLTDGGLGADLPYEGVTETRQYRLSVSGNTFDLWGAGPIVYVIGAEYQQSIIYYSQDNTNTDLEGIDETLNWLLGSTFWVGQERPTRDTGALFTELSIPLIGPDMNIPLADSLNLTLQMRYDRYETQGVSDGLETPQIMIRYYYWDPFAAEIRHTVRSWPNRILNPSQVHTAKVTDSSPRIGIYYKPTPTVTWRMSWQRSFNAPNWRDQFSPREPFPPSVFASSSFRRIVDPYDPDGPTEITRDLGVTQVTQNYTPDIDAEHLDNWSASLEWAPEILPGLRLSLDWRKAEYTDRIARSTLWIYDNPEWLLGLDEIAVRDERGNLQQVIHRNINISADYNEMFDAKVEYQVDTRWGLFMPQIGYSRYLDDYRKIVEDSPEISNVGELGGPNVYQWNASLGWEWNSWSAFVYMKYTPSYVDPQFLFCNSNHLAMEGTRCTEVWEYASQDISSLTTVDMTVTYQMDNGLRNRAGGTNILDREAPLAISRSSSQLPQPYDASRWDAKGQVLFLELNWEFGADD